MSEKIKYSTEIPNNTEALESAGRERSAELEKSLLEKTELSARSPETNVDVIRDEATALAVELQSEEEPTVDTVESH